MTFSTATEAVEEAELAAAWADGGAKAA